MKTKYLIVITMVVIAIIIGGLFAYTSMQPNTSNANVSITGAGATFPQPFLNATIISYMASNSSIRINYQAVGSGAGISALTQKTADFAASDAPLSANQTAQLSSPAVHIPETIGAITIAYNLPEISSGLHLTGDVIAKIYLGTITKWNDPAITSLNSGITLPDHAISTIHRSEGSGTTNVFTKYLTAENFNWKTQVGSGTSVQWPIGTGSQGNNGVASTVTTTSYTIGYVELAYALENSMTVASIQNPAGNFIAPSLDSTTIAVQAGASQGLPTGDESWTSVSLLNTNDPHAYPLVSFTYLLEYKELNAIPGMTPAKATAIVQYFWYVIHEGQNLAPKSPICKATCQRSYNR